MEGEHYLIEPVKARDNTSEHFNQNEQIPHQLYMLKHSHNHIHNGSDSSCAVDTGKMISLIVIEKHFRVSLLLGVIINFNQSLIHFRCMSASKLLHVSINSP